MLRLLIGWLCTIGGCANESGASRLGEALDQESNRLRLLSEALGTVDMAPSTESYWVALVPADESSNFSPELPFNRQVYQSVCPYGSSGARILVGDPSGVGCVTSTALDTDELRVVRKTKGDSVHIHLSHDVRGVHVLAMN